MEMDVIAMERTIRQIEAFDEECAAEEYTDTGDAWDLLRQARMNLVMAVHLLGGDRG